MIKLSPCVYMCVCMLESFSGKVWLFVILLNQNKTQGVDYFTFIDLDWFLREYFHLLSLSNFEAYLLTDVKTNIKHILSKSCISLNTIEITLEVCMKQLLRTKEPTIVVA